jgi:hypothetical protein
MNEDEPPLLTPAQFTLAMRQLGQARWKDKSMAERRAHALMMVRARRKKLRERTRMKKEV